MITYLQITFKTALGAGKSTLAIRWSRNQSRPTHQQYKSHPKVAFS
jgi:hypothetical protein